MDNTKSDVRIALSFGLIAFAIVQALTLVTAQRVAPHVEQAIFDSAQTNAPSALRGGINFDETRNSGGIVNTLPVNSSARDEVKRQQPPNPNCLTCINGQPRPLVATPSNPSIQPITQPMVAKPTTPRYSIELFVLHNDRDSQALLNWFNTDATLQKWRKQTNFNVYTRDNKTYLTRFANKIPESSFPAVLVTDPMGGHVYLYDRGSLPVSASALAGDIADKKRIQAEAVARQQTPTDQVMSDMGQSAKDALLDAIVGADCADGKCKPKPFWRSDPSGTDSEMDPVQGLILRLLVRPDGFIFQIVVILAAVVTIVFFVKRGR